VSPHFLLIDLAKHKGIMKKIALAACFALAFALPSAYAQSADSAAPVDPDSAAAVKELLVAMHYRDSMQLMVAQMQKSLPAMHLQSATASINANKTLTEEQKTQAIAKAGREAEQSAAMLGATFDEAMMDDLATEMVPLYARNFTAAELRQMAAFYKTPVGAKMMQVMPQLMGEMIQISQRVMMPRFKTAMEKATKPQ
jgi:Skp family chaperone for outer membrane proteins